VPIDAKYPKLPRYRAALCPETVNALTVNGFAPLGRLTSGMEMAQNLIHTQGAARKVPTESQRMFTRRSHPPAGIPMDEYVVISDSPQQTAPYGTFRLRKEWL